jgi:Ribosomal protein L11 methyltransferase (PrmA)/Arginine methyltransferase oligomerization subdomain
MSIATGYRLTSYGEMITSRPRMEVYARALREAIHPGCVVLDLGAATGIFSLLACKWGAGHVHAVEPDDSIEVARTMAGANGCADRITFHQSLSTAVTLPAPADVIISDLRGVLPLFGNHIPSIVDARRRLLAPGGVLIPRCDTLWAALVDDAASYRPYAEPWIANDYGVDLRAAHPLVVSTWRKVRGRPSRLSVPPQRWATLDYRVIEQPNASGELDWTVDRAGTAHGLLVWFDAELAEGIDFSNAPDQPALVYGRLFFPLQSPIDLMVGDRVNVRISANLVGDDYVWRWGTKVFSAAAPERARVNFQQSTFFGEALALDRLRQREAGHIPRLDEAGDIDRFIIAQIDGQTSLGTLADRLLARFPERFSCWERALARAGEVAERHCDRSAPASPGGRRHRGDHGTREPKDP